jgi:hypothetical protein
VIDLPDLGGTKKIEALGVPVRTLMSSTLRREAAGFRFGGGFWRRARFFDRIRSSTVAGPKVTSVAM